MLGVPNMEKRNNEQDASRSSAIPFFCLTNLERMLYEG